LPFEARRPAGHEQPELGGYVAAVPLKRSIFPNYIVCLEGGKKLKMLKRHMKTDIAALSPA
jgi:predicted transcriptional regulator